ncbi:lasso peptide biosynthesis PqqD family chaperone [Kocuria palustris]|uniref:lasso peptide biosynthesis PqqD family chaperone n=1 Tax=Kocuria palustris TaxID=71999 RepID=UPI003D761296
MKSKRKVNTTSLHRVPTEYGEVLLNEKTGAYWNLNESASRIVAVLENGGAVEDAVKDLVDTYGIDKNQARHDIEAVEASLQKLGAL